MTKFGGNSLHSSRSRIHVISFRLHKRSFYWWGNFGSETQSKLLKVTLLLDQKITRVQGSSSFPSLILPAEVRQGMAAKPYPGVCSLEHLRLPGTHFHRFLVVCLTAICNIKTTCASSERTFQTPDSATSPQTGCETSGDKNLFLFSGSHLPSF